VPKVVDVERVVAFHRNARSNTDTHPDLAQTRLADGEDALVSARELFQKVDKSRADDEIAWAPILRLGQEDAHVVEVCMPPRHLEGRHKARTLMRIGGLRPRWRRKFVHTTDSRHTLPVAENVLDRRFKPTAPDRAWVSDITYVRTRSGWLYLAVVLDLFSRKIVGWAMAPSMPAELVCTALSLAIASRKPAPGLIVHSDRGSQYASDAHTALLARHGLVCSMSRKGNCWDNAVMERFFLNLKMERIWQRDYANHPEAQADIADYIVNFYNAVRLHSTLGYQSPCQYEQQHLAAH